jgi:hypothetical protein
MKVAALAIVFVAALLIALVWFAPASLVDGQISSATQGRLRLAAAHGTLWRGGATLTDATGAWALPLDWRVEPSLSPRAVVLVLEPAPGRAEPRGHITLLDGTLHVAGLSLAVPAAALDGAFVARGQWTPGGELTLDASSFDWNGTAGSGALNLRWRGARIAGGGSMLDLGTLTLDLAPRADRLRGRVANDGGDVRIAGDVDLSGAGASVDATLTPTSSAPREMVRALSALGTPDAGGTVRVQWRGAPR